MTWTTFTPFVPYIRIALVAIAIFYLGSAMWQMQKENKKEQRPLPEVLRKVKHKIVVASVASILAVAVTSSTAYRPKDRIAADHSKRDSYLEHVDNSEVNASPEELEGVGPKTVDWENARSRFRNQVDEEKENFERATTQD